MAALKEKIYFTKMFAIALDFLNNDIKFSKNGGVAPTFFKNTTAKCGTL